MTKMMKKIKGIESIIIQKEDKYSDYSMTFTITLSVNDGTKMNAYVLG
jgi:hypothetical protein